MLDGFEVTVGSRVFDVQFGWGTVTRITPEKGYVVDFRGRTSSYIAGGYLGVNGSKRLFWQDITSVFTPQPGPAGEREIKFVKAMLAHARTEIAAEGNEQ